MSAHHDDPGAFWDERFRHERFAYGLLPNPFLAAEAHRIPSTSRILSLAEGEGRNAMFLAKQGHSVHALDASKEGLNKLAAWAQREKLAVSTQLGDLRHADLGESCWDLVLNVFGHFPSSERQQLNARVAQALKPGGWVMQALFHPDQLNWQSGGPKQADFLVTPDQLAQDFPAFEILVNEVQSPILDEGPLHQGESRITCFLARKAL